MKPDAPNLISRMLPRGLRARLVLLVFLAVIPALALILYTARDQRRMAEIYAESDLMRLSQVVNNEHKFLIEGSRQLLSVLAELPALRNQETQACNETIGRIGKEYPQYIGLGAIKSNGDRFCGGNFTDAAPVNVADRSWFQQTLQSKSFTIGTYQIGRVAKRAVLPLAYPAVDETGKIRAVVLAVIDLDWLKSVVARSLVLEDASLTIVDDKGVILAHHPQTQWLGRSIAGTGMEKALRAGQKGLHALEGIDGVQRLAVFTSFTGDDKSGALHLVLSTPRNRVYGEANQILRRNLFWLGLVFLTVLAAAWFGSEFFVVRPVQGVLQAAQRIAGGDLKARIKWVDSSRELGELARSFNAMACSLEDRQEDAARAEAKVRENERLAAMGATVAGITHEIANPLNGMYSAVQLLELELGEPGAKIEEEIRSVVGNLKNEIERLRSLLQDLRFLARPGQLNLKSVSVGEIAADILELESSNYKERGIRAEADFPASLPPVLGDREKLKQTLLNLCKNAAEAMPNGGQLRLRGFLKDSDLVVEVSDTGVGIPTDLNVFELFTTTKASGLGLGLAIVRQIVAAHGGAISYNSQPGRGTIFQVILPTKVSESTAECLGATIAGRT